MIQSHQFNFRKILYWVTPEPDKEHARLDYWERLISGELCERSKEHKLYS